MKVSRDKTIRSIQLVDDSQLSKKLNEKVVCHGYDNNSLTHAMTITTTTTTETTCIKLINNYQLQKAERMNVKNSKKKKKNAKIKVHRNQVQVFSTQRQIIKDNQLTINNEKYIEVIINLTYYHFA